MNTLTVEGWLKPEGATRANPIEQIHFRVSEECHLMLEQAEEMLQKGLEQERFVPVDLSAMELQTSADCGSLKDGRFRVYLRSEDQRGVFHLVAHQEADNSLVYSNAVLVDLLG